MSILTLRLSVCLIMAFLIKTPTLAMEQQLANAQDEAGQQDQTAQRRALEQQQIRDFISAIGDAVCQLRFREAAFDRPGTLDQIKERLVAPQAEVIRETDRITSRIVNVIKKLAAETQEFKEAFSIAFLTGLIPGVGTGYLLLNRQDWLLQQSMGEFGNLKVAAMGLAHSVGMAVAYHGYQVARMLLWQHENNLSSHAIPLIVGLALQGVLMWKAYEKCHSFLDVTGVILGEALICSLFHLLYTSMPLTLSCTDYVGLSLFAYIGYQALLFLPRSRSRHA